MLTVEWTAVKGVVFMNRIFKVIFNRNRQLVQVVPEYAKNRGKEVSESRKGGVRGLAKVLLTFLATLMIASPGYAADETGSTGSGSIGTSTATATVSQVVIQAGNSITVGEPVTDTEKNTITYTISANGDGTITDGNTGLVTGGKVYTAINNGIQTTIGSLSTNGNYIRTGNSVSGNLVALDTQVKNNADNITKNANDISTETTARETADNSLSNKIGTLDANGNYIQKDASVSSNLSYLDTQVKSNTTDITGLKDLSNITSAGETGIRKQAKKAVQVAATGNATVTTKGSEDDGNTLTYTINVAHNGEIKAGDTNLVSGGTLYTELRPSKGIYVNSSNTTAANLLALDTNLKNVIDAIGLDSDDTTKSYTSKLNKYFKVNPTGTAVTDAAANGTNAVAIGPSAQAGDKSTDATTSTTTITGGTSSTAIGDSAKANGNQSVALGYGSEVLNTTDQSGKTTATISGSTAIGNGAKVNGATDAAAVGTSAQVNETATGGIAFGKNAVTGEDKGTVTVGDVTANVAAVGGENSVALGTEAKASGNTALALGKGAQVNNYTTQSGTTVTKTVNSGSTAIGSGAVVTGANDAVAFGSGAKVEGTGTNADDSLAIGKSASVATAKDAMALGTSASVASGADNAIALGNGAKANTSNTTAIGYNATATGAGAVAIGENTFTSTEGGISIGSGTSVSGKSIVIGYSSDGAKTESQNTDAVAIGNGAQANANDSISIGHQAGKDTAEGRASGYGSLIAIGTNAGNNVKGMQNVALGSGAGSNVKSSYNVAIGSNAGAGINYAADKDSNPQNGYNVSIGYEANYQSADANAKNIAESIAIGHSANAVSNATAMGYQTTASGDKSMAFGYNATAADTDSIAFGDNASAGGGNIAIGHGSQAPDVTSYSSSYLTNNTTLNGYISLGGKTTATSNDRILRRITNVADGSDDQDAVTVAQLKAAYTNLEGTIKTTDTKISDTYTQEAIDTKIKNVESKITASKTKYFSINTSSDTLTANADSDGASTSGAADAMAIGPNATATSAKAIAIGNNVSASGKGSIALGTADNPAKSTTVTAGGNTSANPHVTSAEGANSVAVGTSAIAQTDNSVALGTRASIYTSDVTDSTTGTTTKVGQQSIAIGYQAETRNSNATSIGSGAKAYSNGSTAIGHSAYAQGADSAVIGTSSTANGASSGILGKNNTINGSNTYAVGSENNVNGNWGAVTYSGLYGSKNIVNPVSDTSGNTKHGMDSLSITGNSNTINQGSYSDTVQNISILGNSNSVTGANTDVANAGTTANITVIGGSNTVTGRDGAGSDDMGKTWNQLTRTTVIGYNNTVNQATATTSLADTQILGNDVTATLGNSVYLGTGSAAKNANVADVATLTDAEKAAVDALNTTGMTDREKAAAQAKAKAAARYVTNLAAMKKSGTTAGLQSLSTDTTYDDGTSYSYAGSSPDGVVTVGTVGSERRIQNVAAGLVSATSTDAVNGSQLYALTRQIRFGGDNSSFGTTTADDKNVVARGSNETLNIIGGEKDSTKLTDNNIGVVSDGKDTLTVKLSKNVNLGNDGSVAAGNTTLDTNGITITNGPKFTSSSIDADSQKITSVKAGEADTDAANVGQVKSARTLLTQGTNTQLADTEANGHHTYVVNVDNLAVKANGTGNTTVELANGINFVNGTNTTAAVGTDGTVTISATHNKLSMASAAPTGTKDDVTLTLTDADGNTVTSTGLKNTYTTVTKDGTAHKVTFARNDGITQTLSLGDLDGASKGELATTAAKATSEVTNGTNVASVTKTAGANGQNIYTVNVDDLAVKTTDGEKKSVHLADGLVFADGTNTTATVGDNGTIKFNVSDNAIKKQAVNAINVTGGSNVTVTPGTNADGTLKTFTVTATHNKLNATGAATQATADSNAVTLTLQDADGNTTTTGLTDTYTTVSKDATNKKVTFKRNDGETQTLELSDLGGITAAQDKYVTGGKVTYNDKGDGTAALTGNNGLAASITGLKDTKVSSGTASYVGTQGNASGSATLTMNDGSKVAITGLKDDYITSAAVGAETNHVTMTRLGGGTVDLNLNPILEKYSLSDYRLVGNGDSQDQAYQVNADGTVTLNVVDAKNTVNKRTIQITGLASQSGVNAGRTTVKSSDNSVTVSDSTANSDTHTYDIKVDYSKIPGHVSLSYTGDTGSGSNTLNNSVKFAGTTNQVTTTAKDGQVTFALASDIKGINSVTTGNTTLSTNGVSNGKMSLTGTGMTITDTDASKQISVTTKGVFMGSQRIQNVANAEVDTDAATLGQVKNARTIVAAGSNVASVTPSKGANNQMTYTVNVDNLSVKANNEAAKSVTLQNGLTFNDGTNTTASVGENGAVSYNLNQEISLTKVTAGSSTLDTSGLSITGGPKFTKNGIDAGSQKITGVANGENAHDAVNKGQLDALQSQVTGGWNLAGKNSDGTAVTAKIGAGKTVTYTDGAYTKSVVTKGDDDSDNATVKVDVTTGTLTVGADGRITSANGLATTQDVANAINSASITVVADNTPDNKTSVKAGDTIHFAKDDNLTLTQDGTKFTYGLKKEISISKVTTSDATNGSTVQDAKGITTTDAAGNTYIQDGQGITLTPSDKTKSPVKLTNTGLNNGGNKITGVGKGTDDADAVNVSQLKEVQAQVGSGWQIAGNDGQKVADIGAGKKVSFKTGSQYLTANTESAGTDAANVTYGLKTKTLTAADGKVSAVDTAEDGLATAKNVAETINQTYWTAASGTSGSGSHTDETANPVDKQISAGDTVTFNAGNNLSLVQNGASFTYGLQADLTGMNTITFTRRNDADGHPISLVIGKQKDGVSNDEGYYITGLDNTSWNQSNYVKNRAATEAQLASAIQQVTLASQSGGFKLSDDNNNEVSQVLGKAIGVVGDGNITTTAETTTADPNGHIKVSLNKHIDLGTDGSLQAGGVTLKDNRVTVGNNGIVISSSDSERTVSNLSNTTWETAKVNQEASAGGYKGSTKAATESQLAEAISTATSTASANEQHIKAGSYSVTAIDNGDGTKSQGVSIDIVTGDGSKPEVVKGKVVIKDVAKASDVGDVSKLHDTLKNPDGTKNVTGAINNLDNRVTGLDTRMNDIYTTAGQHSSVSSESNIVVDHSAKNESGGTDYKLSLNREKIDLDKVTIEGKSGAVTAKTVTAEEYKVGNKTYISSDGLNANSQKITNVQTGTADTDAANVGQVREADEQLAGGIAQNARNISQLGREVDKLDSRIDRVGAGAAALAALHPGAYDPNDKVDFSAGYGNYRGASAAAVGMYYHPDERTILSMGVAMGGGENMVNAGVTWKLGRRTPAAPQPVPVKAAPGAPALVPVSTAAAAPVRPVETAPAVRPVAVRTSVRPVETVALVAPAARVRPVQPAVAPVRTADTNAQLMELLARQTAILEKLSEQKAVPAAAPAASGDDLFTDVPENHWAYECALKMEKAGVLKGLGGLQVEGNPLLTRKDFARILYTALKNGATTNPALNSDNSLNRMASEFRGELKMVKG